MIHLDTHVVAWLFMGEIERFSRKGQTLLETESLAISPIVALELQYLYEINRISLSGATVLAVVRKDFGVAFATHSFQDIIFEAFSLDWTRDPFDRIIVAHASFDGAPLLTKDESIRQHYQRAVW